MIVDTLCNLSRYRGLHTTLDLAIDWLATHSLAELPDGRTTVDEDRVFINVMEAELRSPEDVDFEYHRRYADLQIDLVGSECWEYATHGDAADSFDADKDIGFATSLKHCGGTLGEGRFVLFLPGELHKPSCITENCTHVRKAVVKIEMN